MLLPDNIHPENTIYYNAAFVLRTIQERIVVDLLDLYLHTLANQKMSMPVFVLCIDWLYLINVITMNDEGKVELCS